MVVFFMKHPLWTQTDVNRRCTWDLSPHTCLPRLLQPARLLTVNCSHSGSSTRRVELSDAMLNFVLFFQKNKNTCLQIRILS